MVRVGARDRCLPCFDDAAEAGWRGDWGFVCLADTQFGMLRHDESWGEEKAMLLEAAARVNALSPPPRFVCVCGDLVNAWPRRGASGADGEPNAVAQAQVDDLQAALDAFRPDVPLLCLCGNHDIGNRPNAATIQQYRQNWGDDYFSFRVGGCLCVAINSSLYHDPTDAAAEAQAHEAWLDATLRAAAASGDAKPVHTLLFGHIPPFLHDPSEPTGYFNWPAGVRRRVLDQLHASRANVHAWFCGHYHRNAGGWDGTLEVVTTAAVGTNLLSATHEGSDPLELSGIGGAALERRTSGLRLVHVSRDRISHLWCSMAEEMPPAISAAAERGAAG